VSEDPYGFAIGVLTIFGFSVLLAYFILFVVKEKESGSKHLQFVSGVHSSTYWLANYLFDNFIILIVIALSTIVVAVFQISSFSTGENLAAVVLLMVSSPPPPSPPSLSYIISYKCIYLGDDVFCWSSVRLCLQLLGHR
jgi:hypothetical protein